VTQTLRGVHCALNRPSFAQHHPQLSDAVSIKRTKSCAVLSAFDTDLYPDVVNHSQHLWQAEWDRCVLNKLHSVRPPLWYSNLSNLSHQCIFIVSVLCRDWRYEQLL